jgi:DNA polymerase III subunit epsilon
MRKHNLAFIDTETTGLDFTKHEIIEIGCVITTPKLKIIEKFEIKIKPEHIENADKTSLKINHYNEEDWSTAVTLEDAMKIFSKKVKDCIMVAHNVSFDYGFLEYAFMKNKWKNTMHYHKLDTISIAWAKLHKVPSLDHFSLRELCKYFELENEHPHSALSDAYATYELYKKLMEL